MYERNLHTLKILPNYCFTKNRVILFSLFSLTLLVYLPFIGNPFIFDDLPFFASGNASNFDFANFNFHPRYFSYATLALLWNFSLDIPLAYRIVSLLAHSLNAILLFGLLSRLSGPFSNNSKIGPWVATAVFAVHPVCTYAVGYTVELSILIATTFVLAMLLCFTRALFTQRSRWLLCSAFFYFLAVFSKEHAVVAPIITVALVFLFRESTRINWKHVLMTWGIYSLIGILIILRMKSVIGTSYEHDAPMLASYQNIGAGVSLHILSVLNQAGLFFKYIFLWCIPNPAWMSIDMRPPFEDSVSIWSVMKGIGFLVYGLFASYLLICTKDKKLIGFALIYPWVFFLVEFSTVRIQEPFVLYRSYLWMPGFLALALLPGSIMQYKKSIAIVIASLLIVLTLCSWNRLWVMGDEYRLWNDAARLLDMRDMTGAARIYYNRGRALQAEQKWQASIPDFKKVIGMHPQIEQAHASLGLAYYNLGQYEASLKAINQAIHIRPDYAYAYFLKGLALQKMHRDDESLVAIERACELKHSTSCTIAAYIKSRKARID